MKHVKRLLSTVVAIFAFIGLAGPAIAEPESPPDLTPKFTSYSVANDVTLRPALEKPITQANPEPGNIGAEVLYNFCRKESYSGLIGKVGDLTNVFGKKINGEAFSFAGVENSRGFAVGGFGARFAYPVADQGDLLIGAAGLSSPEVKGLFLALYAGVRFRFSN